MAAIVSRFEWHPSAIASLEKKVSCYKAKFMHNQKVIAKREKAQKKIKKKRRQKNIHNKKKINTQMYKVAAAMDVIYGKV